jgi:endonuclease/exonuclease/phosphatase family metal-dependent hydrolase
MGDYNFRPDTEQYALMTETLADSWLLRWPGGKPIPDYAPERRIDHIFVSPGTTILESEYFVDPASDHPYMYVVIE